MVQTTYKGIVPRVLSTADVARSRAERRWKIRTSPTIATKKWTMGRVKPYRQQIQYAILQEWENKVDNFLLQLDSRLGRTINEKRRKK